MQLVLTLPLEGRCVAQRAEKKRVLYTFPTAQVALKSTSSVLRHVMASTQQSSQSPPFPPVIQSLVCKLTIAI